jgi:hypothetical protein
VTLPFVARHGTGCGRVAAAPGPGLVDKETSNDDRPSFSCTRTNHGLERDVYRELDLQRRLRKLRRVVVASAEACRDSAERAGARPSAVMVTATYRPGVEWSPRHVSQLTKRYREWCNSRGFACRYQWVLELTRRGVPHYHVLFWLPHHVRIPKPDQAGWWDHGSTRVERARRAVGYLVKYASKGGLVDEDSVPKGARLYGVGNALDERHAVRRSRLPVWLDKASNPAGVPKRVARLGWVCDVDGTVFRSPFEFHVGRDSDGHYCVVFINRGTYEN